ncbi:hypothetical protein Nmel_003249 [Mimus melanotis]
MIPGITEEREVFLFGWLDLSVSSVKKCARFPFLYYKQIYLPGLSVEDLYLWRLNENFCNISLQLFSGAMLD